MADIRINALATTATSSASDDYVAIDGAANGTRKLSAYSPTFGGNLTVSGTSATLNNVIVAASGSGVDFKNASVNTAATAIYGGSAYNTGAGITLCGNGNVSSANAIKFTIGAYSEIARFEGNNGNLLLGTTTDSSNGKLQVAGSIALNTYGNSLNSVTSGGSSATVLSYKTWSAVGNTTVLQNPYGSIVFATDSAGGGTTALTLDSSQNATFAGRVKVSGNAAVPSGTQQTFIGADATNGAQIIGQGSTNDVSIYNSAGNIALRIPTGTQNVTVNGSLAIGNTVTAAASVASTHKVTISIGGVTYYLLASNV